MRYFMFGYAFIVQGKLGSFSGSISLAVNAFPSQTIINRLIMKDMATMHDVHDGLSISITNIYEFKNKKDFESFTKQD
jgi:hypothetical protein